MSLQRKTYNRHGQRYDIDEDTLPEWLDAATATRGRRAAKSLSTDAQREAMIAMPQLIVKLRLPVKRLGSIEGMAARTAPQLTVKLRLNSQAARAFLRSIATPAAVSSSASVDRSMVTDVDAYTPPARDSSSSSELPSETGAALAPYKLLLDPPYVAERDQTRSLYLESGAPSATEARETFYGSHMFCCQFFHPTKKFLLQLDSRYLRCLKPGSVRLTDKLIDMKWARIGLEHLNQRGSDGLRPDVVVMPITVEIEEDEVWVSLANVDDFEDVKRGSADGQGKMARRKPTASLFHDSDDDELYT